MPATPENTQTAPQVQRKAWNELAVPPSAGQADLCQPENSPVGRSEFYLIVGDGIVVPFQAVAGDVWQVQRAGVDLERAG